MVCCSCRLGSLLLIAGVFILGGLSAQAQPMHGGARAAALGGAATALSGDAWGYANPAAWSTLPGPVLSVFASQAYGLAELRLGAAHLAYPTALGTFAVQAQSFGFEDYRESTFGVGYARGVRLGTTRTFHVGLTIHHSRIAIARYGTTGAVGLSVAWLVAVLPTLHAGFHATNLNRPSYVEGADLPRTFAFGLSYEPAPGFLVLADVWKDVRFPTSVRGGLEVTPLEALALRAGVATEPTRFTSGVGLRLGPLAADVAAERHYVLGWSPGVALGVQW